MRHARVMLCLLLVIAASLGLLALLPAVAEAQWCAGAYDAKQGTNFGACPAGPTVSLYKRLGGRHPIAVVVDSFVANLVADSRVNARFKALKPAEVNRLKANLSDQICEATGGPCSYLGRDMKTTHQGMRITEAEWSATVENLVKALDQHKVGAGEKQELLGKLGPMKADIVGQ